MIRCEFEYTTHDGLNRKQKQKCTEKENQVILALAFIDKCCNIIYNNIGTILQSYQVGRYEWTNSVTPERTHRWNWTDG